MMIKFSLWILHYLRPSEAIICIWQIFLGGSGNKVIIFLVSTQSFWWQLSCLYKTMRWKKKFSTKIRCSSCISGYCYFMDLQTSRLRLGQTGKRNSSFNHRIQSEADKILVLSPQPDLEEYLCCFISCLVVAMVAKLLCRATKRCF